MNKGLLSAIGIQKWELRTHKQCDVHFLNLNTDWLVIAECNEPTKSHELPSPHQNLLAAILKASKAKEVSLCVESLWSWLDPELSHFENFLPKVILIMGEYPAQVFCKTRQSLEALRGKIHTLNPHSCPVVVTYSLGHLLSNPKDKRKTWQDLQRVI